MRYLATRLMYLWSLVIPPPHGRHARTTRPSMRPRASQLPAACRPQRASVPKTGKNSTTPAPPPLPQRPDRHLVRPYYRAWEQGRAEKRDVRTRTGSGVLQTIVQRPSGGQPPADLPGLTDLSDLADAVRRWQVFTGVRA